MEDNEFYSRAEQWKSSSERLEAKLLEQPLATLVLLVLGFEDLLGCLKELLLHSNFAECVGSQCRLKLLAHRALDTVPGGHKVGEVDHLDEGLDGGALLHQLLHLGGGLAHGAGDRKGSLRDTYDDAVAVRALQQHDDLPVLQKLHCFARTPH